jgi:hypothetical protein
MRTGTYDWDSNTKDYPGLPELVKFIQKEIAQTDSEIAAKKAREGSTQAPQPTPVK